MDIPIEVAFKNMERSEALETRIREKAEKLDRHREHVTACRVVVEAPHHHQQQGNLFEVRIDIRVRGGEIVVNREGPHDPAHADAYVAVRDAFAAATRQLDEYTRRLAHH